MCALLEHFAASGVRLTALPDGRLHAAGALSDTLRAAIRAHKPAILAELAAANDAVPPVATPEQAAELRALVSRVTLEWPNAERAEALAVALADPDAALVSFRALSATQQPLAATEPDHRRTCQQCANLSGPTRGGFRRCLAAWRGEPPAGAAREYHPVVDVPRRCESYTPMASELDQRTGAQRWSSIVVDTEGMRRADEGVTR